MPGQFATKHPTINPVRRAGLILCCCLTLLAAACTARATSTPVDLQATVAAAVLSTQLALPTATQPPPPTPTTTPLPTAIPPTPTNTPLPPTPQPYLPLAGQVGTVAINLRSGPGVLHARLNALAADTSLSILGKAPGSEWVLVQTPANQVGWVAVLLLNALDLSNVPVFQPAGTLVIAGQVIDSAGKPVDQANIAVWQGQSDRVDSYSGADGFFYAYLPEDKQGTWTVEIVGIGCTSRIVDNTCAYTGTFEPANYQLQLPITELLTFTYK